MHCQGIHSSILLILSDSSAQNPLSLGLLDKLRDRHFNPSPSSIVEHLLVSID